MELSRIEPIGANTLSKAENFVRSWTADDIYERFGTLGSCGPDWLITELTVNQNHRAFLAFDVDKPIALLDYVDFNGEVHFGIVVDAAVRRSKVGSALVFKLLADRVEKCPVAAECRADNAAAIGLLRSCGFERLGFGGCGVVWRHT